MKDWRNVPLPERMQKLPKDVRGLPIPANVLIVDGKPYFTINDDRWTEEKAIGERRCSLCGDVLTTAWFIGGPLSCFDENGAFRDPPVHRECGHYALQVCPYLVVSTYNKRIDDKQAKQDALARKAGLEVYVDPTVISSRPTMFGFVQVGGYRAKMIQGARGFIPKRPYINVELWGDGRRLTDEDDIQRRWDAYREQLGDVEVKMPYMRRVQPGAAA